jgi:hypothetical protein
MITRVILTKALCLGVLARGATAQDVPAGVKYDLTGLTYSRVGRLARVQGVVRLQLIPSEAGQEVKFISGPAMLAREALENLPKWRTNQSVTVNYIFGLTDPEFVKVRLPKGNAFDRLWLRMFHLPTYSEQLRCQQTSATDFSPRVTGPRVIQQSPLIMEVQVTALTSCLVMVSSGLVASR